MLEDPDAMFARDRSVARKRSDWQWEMARVLVEAEETGRWRERYVRFDQYIIEEMDIFPGMGRELLRVQKKLNALGIDRETAERLGYVKLRIVAAQLTPENWERVLQDLETGNVQVIRDKYCPRKPRVRQAACGPRDPHCPERNTRGDRLAEPGPIPPEAVKAVAVKVCKGLTTESVKLKRKPGHLDWTDAVGQKHTVGLFVDVTPNVSDAIHVARREWGVAYREQDCVDAICALYVTVLGTEAEKEEALSRLLQQRDKLGRPLWAVDAVPEFLQQVEQTDGWRR